MTPAFGKICALVVALAASLHAMAAHAQDVNGCPGSPAGPATGLPVPEVVTQEVFDALVGWIALNTSYDLSPAYHDPPTLSFCGIGEIVAYEEQELLVEEGLLAAFDYPRRHIYLVRPWSRERPFDLSVLLHELIHDVQLSNREWDCLRQPELEAYVLQDKWLRDHGIFHPFDWAAILDLSRCRDGDAGAQ